MATHVHPAKKPVAKPLPRGPQYHHNKDSPPVDYDDDTKGFVEKEHAKHTGVNAQTDQTGETQPKIEQGEEFYSSGLEDLGRASNIKPLSGLKVVNEIDIITVETFDPNPQEKK